MSQDHYCPKCQSAEYVKSGIIKGRQRYKCKSCNYFYTVQKLGKRIDDYYVTKALQLYVEGVSYREIERILGISHVSVMNWVKTYGMKRPQHSDNYHPSYKILTFEELSTFMSIPENVKGMGMIVTEIGDKFMLIKWERFKR
jgi:transposase-like protein